MFSVVPLFIRKWIMIYGEIVASVELEVSEKLKRYAVTATAVMYTTLAEITMLLSVVVSFYVSAFCKNGCFQQFQPQSIYRVIESF